MKRFLQVLILAAMLCGTAFAAGVTNPDFLDAHFPPVMAMDLGDKTVTVGLIEGSQLSFNSCNVDGNWTAVAQYLETDASGNNHYYEGDFDFKFFLIDSDSRINGFRNFSKNSTYTYDFVVPGNYILMIVAQDAEGNSASAQYRISVTDSNALTVRQKVNQLVYQCKNAGCDDDYEKALWFHDWLTMNACYDSSLSYYSADGVLLRGTGVCDSYSYAYQMLLEAAGVSCEYFPGYDMNHSWNQVKLNGQWYNVDVTWDDPLTTSNSKVSGFENHTYFALPDELHSFDHSYTPGKACTSYTDNYFIRTGKVSAWSDGLINGVQAEAEEKKLRFAVDVPETYVSEIGIRTSQDHGIIYGLAAHDLEQKKWSIGGNADMMLYAKYDAAAKVINMELNLSGATLVLPESLTQIGTEAFAGASSVMAVEIPDGTASIGDGAFSDCPALWKAVIPSSVAEISETAFTNCPNLYIVCEEGSEAESFAKKYFPERYFVE